MTDREKVMWDALMVCADVLEAAAARIDRLEKALRKARLWVDGALVEACDEDLSSGSAAAAREMLNDIDDALAGVPAEPATEERT